MVSEITAGVIFIVWGLLFIVFKRFFSSIIRSPGGFNSQTLKKRFGEDKGSKIIFYIGIVILVVGIIMLTSGMLGLHIFGIRIA